MKISETLSKASHALSNSSSPQLDAEILLSHTLNTTREHLLTHPEQELTQTEQNQFSALLEKRKNGTPIAYIIGEKEFFGDTFIVNANVLIPRPETETLIEFTLEKILNAFGENPEITLADVGTGSGAIAISLAKALDKATVIASDVSEKALEVVKHNLEKHPEAQNVDMHLSDLLSSYPVQKIDVIFANLPYLSEEVYRETSKEVKHEPKKALVAAHDGMFFYKELFKQLKPFINEKMLLTLEIDPHQFEELKTDLRTYFPNSNIEPIFSEDKKCTLGLFAEIEL